MSRASFIWTVDDQDQLRGYWRLTLAGQVLTPLQSFRFDRLLGRKRRVVRRIEGPRKAVRRTF